MSASEHQADPPSGAITALEYETMLLGRHLSLITGASRRREGHLDRSAYTLLARLESVAMSIGELARISGLDPSTLNRQTAAMLRDGLVERAPDPDGGIARRFHITGEGRRRLHDTRARNLHALGKATSDWSDEEIATFGRLLSRFNRGIEQLNGLVWSTSEQPEN